ncbi:MAG: Phosphate regulon sensor protein PhoR (SphS) [uncultured Chloroflexi bacterium]|uniref:histidine kinase n=1 Tax=uncultured Chloroflexota bacterium TaxID=166587 RepID=A0A6J4KEH4_9CHLR|nr:MAG: Phosphate regulon sensor protein PhoR (SphS) [uncultured Chloroflexota bacterium]
MVPAVDASAAVAAGSAAVESAAHFRHDQVLADIARFAGSSLDLEEVLERIVERAAALTGADRSSIWLLDRAGRKLLPSALFGMDRQFTDDWKGRPLDVAAEPLSRDVIENSVPVVVEDAQADPRTDKASVEFFGDKSILVVPMARRGRVIGTLYVNHVQRAYAFTAEDVDTAVVIASQAAVAIDNARLYGEARQLADQLRRSFRHAGEALAAAVDVQRNLELLVQLAMETVGADGGTLELLAEDGRGTETVAGAGAPTRDGWHRARFPLAAEGGALRALELWREAPDFDDQERSLLAAFAGHARSAIEHARLYASLHEERERARQAEKTQEDFVSMVSHELRTPLALIKGYVSTLLRPPVPLSPERTHRFVEGIETAASRLQRLIDDLLSAARLENDPFEGTPRPVEARALVQRAVSAAGMLANGREISVELPDTELWFLGDQDQLGQVLENLIVNALKYAPGDTPVHVRAKVVDERTRLSVRDAGPGIPQDSIERIFEKFFRVTGDAERNGVQQGLGLGLYICRRIVEAHGGSIWAENVPGGGSAFHVELATRS